MTKIREALSDEKHDWEHRVTAVSAAQSNSLVHVCHSCRIHVIVLWDAM